MRGTALSDLAAEKKKAERGGVAELDVDPSRESAAGPRVALHSTLSAVRELEKPWRALLAQNPGAGPFLDFEWICTWIELFGRGRWRPHVLAVHDGSELIGIAPWGSLEPAGWREPQRLGFLGAEHTAWDYLDVLCAPQSERAVASALYAHLFGPGAAAWQRLELRGTRAGSAFLFHFGECFEQAGKHVEVAAGAYCPRRRIVPGTPLEGDPALRRMRLRYHRQRLERAGTVQYEVRTSLDREFDGALAAVAALYRQRWGGTTDALRCVEAHAKRMGAAAELRVDLLRVDARPVAGLVHLQRADALHMYLMAVDREAFHNVSVGNVLLACVLERAAAEGVRLYDFLRGGEDYKHRWSNEAERCLDFSAQRAGVAVLLQSAVRCARQLLKIAWR